MGSRKQRFLIVEDELFVAMHLEAILEEIGYEVIGIASSGENALKDFRLHAPDFVLMDINLGRGMDGVTTAQQMRLTRDVQIIFVSAYSDAANKARIEAAFPGSRLLSKPVAHVALKDAITAQTKDRH